jgi:hypothetical protein
MEKFAKKRPYLFWSTNNYKNLSPAVVLENTLNFGDFDDVKEVVKLIGLKKSAAIFKKQISGKRINYRPEIANYFKLYFKKYAR